jgi:hypothetical protein
MRISTLIPLFVILSVMTCVARSPVQAQVAARRINWTQRSSGYVFRWNDHDLRVTKAATGRPVYSVVETVKREVGKVAADDILTYYDVSFAPLSVVGPYLSYQRNDSWDGGAHPSGSERFVTVDVRDPKRRVKLTDLFPADVVRSALLKDAVVRRILRREKIAPPPTLDGLLKALANQQFGGEDDNMYLFPPDLLESFAFHHVEDGKVAVRFLLPHGSEIYRFRNTQVGVLLPVPAPLKTAFAQAATGKNGVLMQSLRRSTGTRLTNFVLHSRKDANQR